MAQRPWIVLPHDPIVKHENNLWSVEGDLPNIGIRRRMTLMRTKDGRILVHSPIPLAEDSMREIEAWGSLAYVIPPNAFHTMDVGPYARRYPEAKVLCDPMIAKKIAKLARVDGSFDELPRDQGIRVDAIAGTKNREPCFTVDSEGKKSLVFTDAVFNAPHGKGISGALFRWVGSTGGPRVTNIFRLAAVKDKHALRDDLTRLSMLQDVSRVIMAHGHIVEGDVAGFMRDAVASL